MGPPGAVRADPSLRRVTDLCWIGGAPRRIFRVTAAGDRLLARLAEGGTVRPEGAGERRLLGRLLVAGAAHPVPEPGSGPWGPRDVTVVVPVRDRPRELDRLLAALATCSDSVAAVVVVDDASLDPSAHEEVTASHGARLLRFDSSRGPGGARVAGAAVAGTPVVAFLDSDVTVAEGWLDPLLAHFADPDVVAVAPRVRSRPGAGALAAYERHRSPLDLGPVPARVGPGTAVTYVPSAALVVEAEGFAALGGFDPALRHGEDVDLVWRAVAAGRTVRYEPSVEVHHDPRPTWARWARQRADYGASAAALDSRHPGDVAPALLSPWSAAVWGLAAAGRPVAALAAAGGSAAAATLQVDALSALDTARLVMEGHVAAGVGLASAAVRAWWPALAVGAAVSRRCRRAAAAAVAVRLATSSGPAWVRVVGLADDVAYGAGLWRGAVRERRPGALLPRLVTRAAQGRPASVPKQ